MKNSIVIINKQLKDTFKNKAVLIQFVLFPLMTLIMENAVKMDNMPQFFFIRLFSIMYIGMAPVTVTAAIIAEEKEKNTLRVLMMADVKPWQYLAGIGAYVWSCCMIGAGAMAIGLNSKDIPFYMLIMAMGFVISIIAGACIGVYAKDQMAATSLYMPFMMILSFAPMLAMFNEKIEKASRFLYTWQLKELLNSGSFQKIKMPGAAVILINAFVLVISFLVIFRKKGLES